jgi:hypothetical protein
MWYSVAWRKDGIIHRHMEPYKVAIDAMTSTPASEWCGRSSMISNVPTWFNEYASKVGLVREATHLGRAQRWICTRDSDDR